MAKSNTILIKLVSSADTGYRVRIPAGEVLSCVGESNRARFLGATDEE